MAVDAVTRARPVTARRGAVGGPDRGTPAALVAVLVAALALRIAAGRSSTVAAAELGFVSLFVESLPFLLLGAVLSNLLRSRAGQRILTAAARRPRLAAALAPFAGLALPLCDCGLLPLARRLRRKSPRAVNAFLAGAPLTNPIVIVTTALAFPHSPGVVVARVLCGFGVAAAVGALVAAPSPGPAHSADCGDPARHDHAHDDAPPHDTETSWLASVAAELGRTGPALVVGAALAATLKAVIPIGSLTSAASQPLLGAMAMMVLAFVMSICSQADAFVAAALPVGALPQLAFMVLGPVLDLRLAVLYRREFGLRWVLRYAAVVVPVVLLAVTAAATAGLL